MQQSPQQVPTLLDEPGINVSDARELLLGYLAWYREALMRKLSGLSDAQLRTPVQPLGWSPLGLVQHQVRMAGRLRQRLPQRATRRRLWSPTRSDRLARTT
ncbi:MULTISPECIES: DUF664 domain-containing protein [Streptomyces]|uniref:mycothiol transferase n=1 Tax=Streptomyces lycopersici TaxID=2974589 RepID=UPI00293ED95B|nr:DUF664 domain-containing protein [Streptomyces sp. NEAU-383]